MFDPDAVADQLTRDLVAEASPERAVQEKAYLKSSLEHLGATVPQIRAAVKAIMRANPQLSHDEVIAVVDALWAEPVHERRFAAVEILEERLQLLGPGDLAVVERLVRDARAHPRQLGGGRELLGSALVAPRASVGAPAR